MSSIDSTYPLNEGKGNDDCLNLAGTSENLNSQDDDDDDDGIMNPPPGNGYETLEAAESLCAKGERTLKQLKAIMRVKLDSKKQEGTKMKEFTRHGEFWFREDNMTAIHVTDGSPLPYLENIHNLIYKDAKTGDKVCLALPQDDEIVLAALPTYFESLGGASMILAAEFFKTYIHFGNWSAFVQRNNEQLKMIVQDAIDSGLGKMLRAKDDFRLKMEIAPTVSMLLKAQQNSFTQVFETAQQANERREAEMRAQTERREAEMRAQAERREAAIRAEMRADSERREAEMRAQFDGMRNQFEGIFDRQRVSNDENIRLIAGISTGRAQSTPRGGSPRSRAFPATERKAKQRPAMEPRQLVTPASAKATPAKTPGKTVVKRAIKAGYEVPDCGFCRRTWNNKFTFCKKHQGELEEKTELI